MQLADNYRELLAHQLVNSARQGIHTVPQALADDYDELLQLIADGKDPRDRWLGKDQEQAAERLAIKLTRLHNYGGRDGLIREHIAPALDTYLTKFKQARHTAGTHALQPAVTAPMLLEPKDVREAIVFIHNASLHYGQLRNIWAQLRGGTNTAASTNTNVDPRGANSPLGECRNIHDLVPDWWNAGTPGYAPWPWGNTYAAHVRLAWLIDHGAQLWAPTAAEHDRLYCEVRDAALESRRASTPARPLAAYISPTAA